LAGLVSDFVADPDQYFIGYFVGLLSTFVEGLVNLIPVPHIIVEPFPRLSKRLEDAFV
jgi:hypothetical protein